MNRYMNSSSHVWIVLVATSFTSTCAEYNESEVSACGPVAVAQWPDYWRLKPAKPDKMPGHIHSKYTPAYVGKLNIHARTHICMPAKVVPSLLMKGQLTDCPRKTGWVCTQEPNPLPNLIFQPQSVLPWTIYTTQGFFSMSPLHHSYCHCTCKW